MFYLVNNKQHGGSPNLH